MNYRQLKALIDYYVRKFKDLQGEYRREQDTYSTIHNEAAKSRTRLVGKIIDSLSITGTPAENLKAWEAKLGIDLFAANNKLAGFIETVDGINKFIESESSIAELKAKASDYRNSNTSLLNAFYDAKLTKTEVSLVKFAEAVNKFNPTDEEITKARDTGFFMRLFFSETESDLRKAVLTFDTAVNVAREQGLNENSGRETTFVLDKGWKELLDSGNQIKADADAIFHQANLSKVKMDEYAGRIASLESKTDRLNQLSDTHITTEIMRVAQNSDITDLNLEEIANTLGFSDYYSQLQETRLRRDAAEKVLDGLRKQTYTIEKIIKDLTKNDYKLNKAARKAVSRTVRNFNESSFKRQMDDALTNLGKPVSWARSRSDSFSTLPIHVNSTHGLNMFYLYLFTISDDVGAEGGAMLLSDELSYIQEYMPEIQEIFSELPAIDVGAIDTGAMDFETPDLSGTDFSMPDLSSVSIPEVSIPDVSVPDVSVPDVSVPDVSVTVDTTTF